MNFGVQLWSFSDGLFFEYFVILMYLKYMPIYASLPAHFIALMGVLLISFTKFTYAHSLVFFNSNI